MATYGVIRKNLEKVLMVSADAFGKGGIEDQEIKTGRLVCSSANSIATSLHAELRARDQVLRNGGKLESLGAVGSLKVA